LLIFWTVIAPCEVFQLPTVTPAIAKETFD